MKNSNSHVYLYAKGWYKRDPDIFVDLKKIYSLRNGIDIEYMGNRDVLSCLLSLAAKHMCNDKGMGPERAFIDFISIILCPVVFNSIDSPSIGIPKSNPNIFFSKISSAFELVSKTIPLKSTTTIPSG